jgi:hypothetical protein
MYVRIYLLKSSHQDISQSLSLLQRLQATDYRAFTKMKIMLLAIYFSTAPKLLCVRLNVTGLDCCCTHSPAGATCQTLRYAPPHQLVLPAKHSGMLPLTSWCYLPNTQECTHSPAGATCQTLRYASPHKLVLPAKHSAMLPLTSWCYLPNTQVCTHSPAGATCQHSGMLPLTSWC